MEKRFTLKDFLLFTAVAAVLIALLVAMYMIDRQWLICRGCARRCRSRRRICAPCAPT